MAAFKQYLREVLSRFPVEHIRHAFCYGSGVFQQHGSEMSKNMLDFIIISQEPEKFHEANLKSNPRDYSFVRYLGTTTICKLQGHGVYFNTMVPYKERLIKYGVVSHRDFTADMFDWTSLYVSGRLHKPVLEIFNDGDSAINAALQNNLENAMHCSLLMMPDTFSEKDLYMTLASLSYSGDFRMTVGEDKNKVSNIVTPNMDQFRALYTPILNNEEFVSWDKGAQLLEQVPDYNTRFHHLNHLPFRIQEQLVDICNKDGRSRDAEEVLRLIASNHSHFNSEDMLRHCIAGIVRSSSYNQTIKSALSAGVAKSVKYAFAKLRKMIRSPLSKPDS